MEVSTIRLELTNQCNLFCKHCFKHNRATPEYLPLKTILEILKKAKPYGVREIGLTGGEPTLHPQFEDIISALSRIGYSLHLFTNGSNLRIFHKSIARFKNSIGDIRLSLDGAEETTHDNNRGRYSYRSVREAIKICRVEGLPFSFNTVVTQANKHELGKIAEFAVKVNCKSVFFSHLQLTKRAKRNKLELSIKECISADRKILELKEKYAGKINIYLCVGYYVKSPFYVCRIPLNSFSIDCRGNINYCILLANLDRRLNGQEIIGNVQKVDLTYARKKLINRFLTLNRRKFEEIIGKKISPSDHFPCRYCIRYFEN